MPWMSNLLQLQGTVPVRIGFHNYKRPLGDFSEIPSVLSSKYEAPFIEGVRRKNRIITYGDINGGNRGGTT